MDAIGIKELAYTAVAVPALLVFAGAILVGTILWLMLDKQVGL